MKAKSYTQIYNYQKILHRQRKAQTIDIVNQEYFQPSAFEKCAKQELYTYYYALFLFFRFSFSNLKKNLLHHNLHVENSYCRTRFF